MRTIHDKIIGPDMVPILWPFADTGTIPSYNLLRLGCRWELFSPSRRQIRSTRLWFTNQPRSVEAVIRR